MHAVFNHRSLQSEYLRSSVWLAEDGFGYILGGEEQVASRNYSVLGRRDVLLQKNPSVLSLFRKLKKKVGPKRGANEAKPPEAVTATPNPKKGKRPKKNPHSA